MGNFNSFADVALQLQKEGETISITFEQGIPTTGQGTVSWDIPAPAAGCESGQPGVYSGMVVLLSTSPVTPSEIPQDGTMYVGDPTANADLHAGDKIGDAIVVGAFYEAEEKARGEELTVGFVVNDLDPNETYYLAGYATDDQKRYHSDGVRAYSDKLGGGATPDIPARQPIQIGQTGVFLSDATGLTAGKVYEFDLMIDTNYPCGTGYQEIRFAIDGVDAPTYQQLMDEINRQILLAGNPPQSPTPPGTGSLYWNDTEQQLYQWDGYKYIKIDTLTEPTDPANVVAGTFWYNPASKELFEFGGSPLQWVARSFYCYSTDPTNLGCDDHWFNGTIGRVWNGTTWCELPTIISTDCPSDIPVLPCGTFWYDEANMILSEWDTTYSRWNERAAIYWPTAPNALADETHWYDLDTKLLFVRAAAAWVQEPATFSTSEPIAASDGAYWYNPENEELRQYILTSDLWTLIPCLVWPGDPTDVTSCDLWWQAGASPESLFVWDTVNDEWDEVKNFVQSSEDPSLAATYDIGTVWYDPDTNLLKRWDGAYWNTVEFLDSATDPTIPSDGQVWNDCANDKWYRWMAGSPGPGWIEFNPVDSETDPTAIPNGTYWYDTGTDALFVRNGVVWQSVGFSTSPSIPNRGDMWYDSQNDLLYTWDGLEWEAATPVARVYLDCNRNFLFETANGGSDQIIFVPVPEGAKSGQNTGCIATGYADFDGTGGFRSCGCTYSVNGNTKPYPTRLIPLDDFLWEYLVPDAAVLCPMEGSDGQVDEPTYRMIGIGDDGSPDERRKLIEDVRMLLGYPTVNVELTEAQLDKAVDRALDVFRQRSSASLRRGFMFLDIKPGQQRYHLTNQRIGYHKIVNVTNLHRFTSAFLSSAHGAGVYGQVVLQHLYNMGTFDLTSFFLVSQYIEQLEHLFATRLTFAWDESGRMLDIYASFWRPERVMMEVAIEKTEQDILTERWSKNWIEQWSLMEAMMMLSQIRGKFATLPGAGGGVSLNAGDLQSQAMEMRIQLMDDIDNFVANKPEDFGMESTFILG